MAEHLIQDTTLTGIADKIRSLLGLTGKMSPAQMQTNLTTEQANITAALAALAEKGVEVPAGANSNGLAGLIAAIEAEGAKVAVGTYTAASNTNIGDITLNHNLGVKPKRLIFMLCDDGGLTASLKRPVPFLHHGENCITYCFTPLDSANLQSNIRYYIKSGSSFSMICDESTVKITKVVDGYVIGGWTMFWIVME